MKIATALKEVGVDADLASVAAASGLTEAELEELLVTKKLTKEEIEEAIATKAATKSKELKNKVE